MDYKQRRYEQHKHYGGIITNDDFNQTTMADIDEKQRRANIFDKYTASLLRQRKEQECATNATL